MFTQISRRALLRSVAAFVALQLCQSGQTATFRVDDSGTTVSTPAALMRWRALVPGRGSDNTAEGDVRVNLRLNLQAWLQRPARIYMGLAPAPISRALRATWRGQGNLLPGSVLSGQRTVVFEGQVTAPVMLETLDLRLTADGRELTAPQSLQFYFEIEPQ